MVLKIVLLLGGTVANQHEFITIRGIKLCHWCGVAKKLIIKSKCLGLVKITTKGGKLTVERRDAKEI